MLVLELAKDPVPILVRLRALQQEHQKPVGIPGDRLNLLARVVVDRDLVAHCPTPGLGLEEVAGNL